MFCQPGFDFFKHHLRYSPYNYLEIGVFDGDSVALLAREFPGKTVYAVDPFIEDGCTTHTTMVNENEFMPTQYENTMTNIKGLDNVTLLEMTSIEFNDILTDELIADMNVSWILIDGSHYYTDVINDVHMAMRIIGERRGGIVFDDVNLEGVGQAHAEFLETYKDRISKKFDIYATHPGHILAYYINS